MLLSVLIATLTQGFHADHHRARHFTLASRFPNARPTESDAERCDRPITDANPMPAT